MPLTTRHVFANPHFAAAHPKTILPDMETEGADIAVAYVIEEQTVVGLFTAAGGAQVAEVLLRTLVKLGFTEEVRYTLDQAELELAGGNAPSKIIVPRNTIERPRMLPPDPVT